MTNIQSGGNAVPGNAQASEAFSANARSDLVQPYEMPFHPANVAFCKAMTATMVLNFGMRLHRSDSRQDFQQTIRHIQRFCAVYFGVTEWLSVQRDLPQFLRTENHPIDLVLFTEKLATLQPHEPYIACAVDRNLDWLTELLQLASVERKILLWSYMLQRSTPILLESLLSDVQCADEAQAKQFLAGLLDEPVEAVGALFAEPSRLQAMSLIDVDTWQEARMLNVYFSATETLLAVLETVHHSREALLLRLLEPETDLTTDHAGKRLAGMFSMWYPPPVARAYRATVQEQPLNAENIAALIQRFCKFEVPAEHCGPLAGHLSFGAIRQAVKQCFVESSRRTLTPVTPLAVLQALYAVAS